MQYVDSFSSRQLFDLVKSIGECRSKHEEDSIIINESTMLQTKMLKHSFSSSKLREYMIRAIYIEMLGHDASFAYIHAIKMTNDKNALVKRIGYLACCIFLNKNHELLVLLVNTLQRDLNSRNQLDVAAALSSLPYLLNNEILSSIENSLTKLLSHQSPAIRRKTYLVLIKVLELKPSIIDEFPDILRRGLCDVDISVINSTLYLVDHLSTLKPRICIPLIPYLVANLKQILENNIPKEYEYHLVPAPWTQINIIEVFSKIAFYEKSVGDQIYEIIFNAIKRVELSISMPSYNGKSMIFSSLNSNNKVTNNTGNISYAILESCIKTITSIYPNKNLLDQVAETISRFLNSEVNYLKYIGIKCLSRIATINPSYAIPHQIIVVDCLEDKDETLRRCTLELLCQMSNPQNIEIVISKLISQLKNTRDQHFREELVKNILNLSEKFAPTYNWYLHTMVNLFALSGEIIKKYKANNIAQIIAEGPTGNESSDFEFRVEASALFSEILREKLEDLPEILHNLSIWVIGEYGSCMNSNQTDIGIKTLKTIHEVTLLLFDVFKRLKVNLDVCLSTIEYNKPTIHDSSNLKTRTSWETISIIILSIMKCYSYTIMISTKMNTLEIELMHKDEIKEKQKLYFEEMNNIYNEIIKECYKYPCNLIYQRSKEFLSLIQLNNKLDGSSTELSNKSYVRLLNNTLPYDASCEEIYVDKNLSFLDDVVIEYKLSEIYQNKISKKNRMPRLNSKHQRTEEFLKETPDNKTEEHLLEISSENEFDIEKHETRSDSDIHFTNDNETHVCNHMKFIANDQMDLIKISSKNIDKIHLDNIKKFPNNSIIQTIDNYSNKKIWGPDGYIKNKKVDIRDHEAVLSQIKNYKNTKASHEKNLESFLSKQKEAMALFSGIPSNNRIIKEN